MSCNCNTASKTCEPCAFCLPPGVTNLPVCENFTSCLETLDVACVTYTGQPFSYYNVTTGEDLWSILLSVLNEIFPPSYCCSLEGTIEIITTTTTSTLPPAYCFSVENTSYVSVELNYTDEGGIEQALTLDPLQTVYICAIEVGSGPGITINELGNCGAECVAPTTTTSTTTIPCQPYYLHCCKNDSVEAPIVIKPCYANVTFHTGDIYVDSNGYYWVVTGTTGTVTSAYTSWGTFTLVDHYSSAQVALNNCQIMASSLQKDDCPGFIPAPVYLPIDLCYSDESCTIACNCQYGPLDSTYYSSCPTLSVGCILYANVNATIVAGDGYYSDGTNCYTIDGGLGEIVSISACYTTTQSPTYTHKYVAMLYNCLAPSGCLTSIGETIVTVPDPYTLVTNKYYRSTDPTDTTVYKITYATSAGPVIVIDPFSQSNTCTIACNYTVNPA